MFSKRELEGYLLIDHRNSPGVSAADIAHLDGRPGEQTPIVGAGVTFESATVTCAHCHALVVLNPNRSRPRNWCPKCDAYVCDDIGCAEHVKSMDEILDELQDAAVKGLV